MKPIDTVDLVGTGHARGLLFGQVRRAQIRACTDAWLESLRAAGIDDPPRYLERMLRETHFLPAIRQHALHLFEEVQGIAAGAGLPPDLLLASQLMDEEWAYRMGLYRQTEPLQKCSSVALSSRYGPTLVGQNMDLGGYTGGHQCLLRNAPAGSEPGALIFTIGAMIALMGVSSAGVAVCVNSLPQLPGASQGLPVAFVVRKLLQAGTLDDAANVVRSVQHATGQHYVIADATEVRSFEASASGVFEYQPPTPGRVLHTNHTLMEHPCVAVLAATHANSVARLEALSKRLSTGTPDLHSVMAALSSRDDPANPVCRQLSDSARKNPLTGMTSFTTGSMISALQPHSAPIDVWVSAGPPLSAGYAQFALAVSAATVRRLGA